MEYVHRFEPPKYEYRFEVGKTYYHDMPGEGEVAFTCTARDGLTVTLAEQGGKGRIYTGKVHEGYPDMINESLEIGTIQCDGFKMVDSIIAHNFLREMAEEDEKNPEPADATAYLNACPFLAMDGPRKIIDTRTGVGRTVHEVDMIFYDGYLQGAVGDEYGPVDYDAGFDGYLQEHLDELVDFINRR